MLRLTVGKNGLSRIDLIFQFFYLFSLFIIRRIGTKELGSHRASCLISHRHLIDSEFHDVVIQWCRTVLKQGPNAVGSMQQHILEVDSWSCIRPCAMRSLAIGRSIQPNSAEHITLVLPKRFERLACISFTRVARLLDPSKHKTISRHSNTNASNGCSLPQYHNTGDEHYWWLMVTICIEYAQAIVLTSIEK